jgi:alpha-1,3-mannosyltransferase
MHIVHVVRQFYPAVGGLENVVKALASEQVRQGHSVRVVTLDRIFNAPDAPRLAGHERVDGVDVVRVPYFGSQRYPFAFSAIRHIRDADLVHVHGVDFFFDYLAWTAPLHRRRLIASTHGGFFHTSFAARLKRIYFNTVTRLSVSRYAGVATVGVNDDRFFRDIRARGICLIENGVDIGTYAGASALKPTKGLISIGRLSSNKRLDRLLAFFAALERIDPGWHLTIAGRSWDVSAADLAAMAASLGVAERVTILENPSNDDIRAAMAGCSCMASASAYEGFGLTLIEAMSAGLWPVASDIPAYSHLIGKSGVGTIADFDEPETAAWRFLSDWRRVASNHKKNRRAAIDAAADYQWRAVGERYQRLYNAVLGQDVRSILDVPILVKTREECVDLIDRHAEGDAPGVVAFANAHTLNTAARDGHVHSILGQSMVFNDGIGVDLASRLLFGKTFPENLNGTDFTPHYLQTTRHRYRVFLLGAKPDVAERTARRLAQIAPQHAYVGAQHGYFSAGQTDDVVAQIRRARADLLLVAFGNPHQEIWLHEHLKATGCRLGFGVGGLFDFVAGEVRRAPEKVQAAHLEWAYRLMQQPRRLWRRYLVQMPLFLLRVTRQWLAGPRTPNLPA